MEPIELFAVIVSGVFVGGFCLGCVAYGMNEGFKHTDDSTMPSWALACIGMPAAFIVLCMFIIFR